MTPGFGSDNHATVHPEIMTAIQSVNTGHAPAYGQDPFSESVREIFKSHFGLSAETFFVFNGTAANVLCLRSFLNSFEAAIAADTSHLTGDECGALEFHGGNKILNVPTDDGKITPSGIQKWLVRLGDQHTVQPKIVSITQPTEWGTVYSLDELRELRRFTRTNGLFLHVDGARYANAAVSLGVDLKTLTEAASPDALSLGGTKNGFLGGEAVILFHQAQARNFKYLHKQEMQLPSKTRFVAAQFKSYLEGDLWHRIAQHSLGLAKQLESELKAIPEIKVVQKVQSNAVFVQFPKAWTKSLKEAAYFYVWDEEKWIARLMVSHDSSVADIRRFVAEAQRLRANKGDLHA